MKQLLNDRITRLRKNNVDHVAFGLCNVWWFHWTDCENVTRWKPTPLKQSQENKAKWTVLAAWIRNDKARVRLVNSPQTKCTERANQSSVGIVLESPPTKQRKKLAGHKGTQAFIARGTKDSRWNGHKGPGPNPASSRYKASWRQRTWVMTDVKYNCVFGPYRLLNRLLPKHMKCFSNQCVSQTSMPLKWYDVG